MEQQIELLNLVGIIYVILPLAYLFFGGVYYLFTKRFPAGNVDKLIDLAKWYMVSVAIVFSAKVVETTFSQRELGIREMEVYDEYVETILNAEDIEKRWRLVEYFAAVTPTERLRERWLAYKREIQDDYEQYLALKAKKEELLTSAEQSVAKSLPGPDGKQMTEKIQELQQVDKQLQVYQQKLIGPKESAENKRYIAAQQWEREGFDYLLRKDVKNALHAFRKSEEIYPGYHSVYKIAEYLEQNAGTLSSRNAEAWQKAYRKILKDFAWGMPEEVEIEMLKRISEQ